MERMGLTPYAAPDDRRALDRHPAGRRDRLPADAPAPRAAARRAVRGHRAGRERGARRAAAAASGSSSAPRWSSSSTTCRCSRRLSDRMIAMNLGKVIATGTPDEVRSTRRSSAPTWASSPPPARLSCARDRSEPPRSGLSPRRSRVGLAAVSHLVTTSLRTCGRWRQWVLRHRSRRPRLGTRHRHQGPRHRARHRHPAGRDHHQVAAGAVSGLAVRPMELVDARLGRQGSADRAVGRARRDKETR